MRLLELVKSESLGNRGPIIVVAAISGIFNAALLAIVNAAAEVSEDERASFRYLLLFAISIAIYVKGWRYTMDRSTQIFETMLHQVRLRIAKKIRGAELTTIDTIGQATVFDRLTQKVAIISQAQPFLVGSLQSLVMVIFVSFYIAWLSVPAFVITFVLSIAGISLYMYKEKETNQFIHLTSEKEVSLLSMISHLLDGFKQVKMRARLGDALIDDFETSSSQVVALKVKTSSLYNNNQMIAQSFFYILMAAMVFLLPRVIPTFAEVLTELTAAVLFIIGPLNMLVTAIPTLARAEIAAEEIHQLEVDLDIYQLSETIPVDRQSNYHDFKEIRLRGAGFSYEAKGGSSFGIKPIDITIKRGECLFIVGGNGSGKSTFLKVLTGLYGQSEGTIEVDDIPITALNRQAYREMFSIIFGDFHLFKKLYGIDDVARGTVLELLKDMEISHKTEYDGEVFTNLDLSTGQRKRIALVVSMLEKRPVYILDEWAADQDPQFREHFYTEIIPGLLASGNTVIAVTHDDAYFHLADRILKFDYGNSEIILAPPSSTDRLQSDTPNLPQNGEPPC